MSKIFSDAERDKLHSRLRVIANGDDVVNSLRAEHVGGLSVRSRASLRSLDVAETRGTTAKAVDGLDASKPRRRKLETLPANIDANVFITLKEVAGSDPAFRGMHRRGNLLSGKIRLSDLPRILENESIDQIELAESVHFPVPLEGESTATDKELRSRAPLVDARYKHGENVLVGVIDVGGFDFAHPDFLDGNETRFVEIWDQGADSRAGSGLPYGARLGREEMNDAIRSAPGIGVAATDLEPQSQMAPGSHATHVASIAAGKHSLLKKASIAGVLVSLPAEDTDRRLSFYDTSRIVHAVDHLVALRETLDKDALVINISLGTNGGAHDGSEPMSRWLDAHLTKPGQAICVAAGNAGQEKPVHEADMGFVSGRIHTEGRIESADLEHDLDWIVVGNQIADISENELEIWYGAQDRFEVLLRPPGESEWLTPIRPGESMENVVLDDSLTVVSIYNELYQPSNGDNKISIYLSPYLSREKVLGVQAGRWTVKLRGIDVRDGHYHGWIERDDPRPRYRGPDRELWQFPSFFHGDTNVDRASLSSLGCGPRVLAVANLDEHSQQINISSSQGPTRDGRSKPDVAAPGTNILAANGFFPEQPWVRKTGTSMASPYVASVVGAMLAIEPRLTAAQIGGILRRTARPLPGATYAWTNDAGYGVVDPQKCVEEARQALVRRDVR